MHFELVYMYYFSDFVLQLFFSIFSTKKARILNFTTSFTRGKDFAAWPCNFLHSTMASQFCSGGIWPFEFRLKPKIVFLDKTFKMRFNRDVLSKDSTIFQSLYPAEIFALLLWNLSWFSQIFIIFLQVVLEICDSSFLEFSKIPYARDMTTLLNRSPSWIEHPLKNVK